MTTVASFETPSKQWIEIRRGDIAAEETDAIVNAANVHLAHGSGVAGAIVRRGGEAIQEESDRWIAEHGPLSVGDVALTGAGRLRCKFVIHAAGPIWSGGRANEPDLLRSAASNSLSKASELRLASIAVPAISSGIFGFPKPLCAEILVDAALAFYASNPTSTLRLIRFTNIDEATTDLFAHALAHATKRG